LSLRIWAEFSAQILFNDYDIELLLIHIGDSLFWLLRTMQGASGGILAGAENLAVSVLPGIFL
jgi:hypothetical protein